MHPFLGGSPSAPTPTTPPRARWSARPTLPTAPTRQSVFLWFALLLALPALVQAQTVQSFSFTAPGAAQTFAIPAGVTSVTVVANGAQGGSSNGGNGGRVTATLSVMAGQVLNIYVGGQNGFNGGGTGADTRSGGGATDIRISGTGLSDRILIAGGGGGGGVPAFTGATPAAGGGGGGLEGGATGSTSTNGRGGTQSAGGGGFDNDPTTRGSLGQGGNRPAGAGGGGGYYGGGSGGSSNSGGGGSSFTSPTLATNVVHAQGVNTGNGSLTISYVAPPTRLYVNANAAGTGDGLTWATAFSTVQQATTYPNSVSVTEIFVAGGLYTPTATLSMKNNVGIYGGFAGVASETSVANRVLTYPLSTTISGGRARTVFSNSDLNNTAILDGFVIANGRGGNGGGILNTNSSPIIRNCSFQNNAATNGGALYLSR